MEFNRPKDGGRVVLSPLEEIQPGRSEWVLAEHGGLGGLSAADTSNAAKTEPKAPAGGSGKVDLYSFDSSQTSDSEDEDKGKKEKIKKKLKKRKKKDSSSSSSSSSSSDSSSSDSEDEKKKRKKAKKEGAGDIIVHGVAFISEPGLEGCTDLNHEETQ
ncbi:uncharacterized protein DDB_G0280579-like [Salvelinus fontinalis]|uniref:uncharacterized protein DDB_G0280579-like n=1 Tax=Salvelinus fontinalis TaxID=8038 RepID=UPI0024865694|nr:uncharacterized protein DDB_G0280579-like [Salvelinus fontinalis]